jgi:hypothetical protein
MLEKSQKREKKREGKENSPLFLVANNGDFPQFSTARN